MATVKSKAGSAGGSGSRKSARELAKAQAAAAQRRGRMTQIIVIGAVALVVIGIIGSAVLISVLTQNSRTPSVNAMVPVAGGKEVPLTVDGDSIRLGPADAKATLDLYVDYACPHCKDYDTATSDTIEQLLGEGNVAVKFHLLKFQSAPYGATAGNASAAVATYQPQNWLAFHSALFVNQTEQTGTWQNADILPFAQQQGIDNPDALKAISEGRYGSWITSSTGEAVKAGVDRTPTVKLNGEAIDLLVGQQLIDRVHQATGS
jgi:protein-disulfide isomerase